MNLGALCLVAVGGALGSVARAVLNWLIPVGRLHWATIVINVAGSLAIGWLMGRLTTVTEHNLRVHSFWVVGICGGFTTFSSFSWQTLEQLQKGNIGAALANVVLSVVACLLATFLGWRLAR
jgi:CrcB protein